MEEIDRIFKRPHFISLLLCLLVRLHLWIFIRLLGLTPLIDFIVLDARGTNTVFICCGVFKGIFIRLFGLTLMLSFLVFVARGTDTIFICFGA